MKNQRYRRRGDRAIVEVIDIGPKGIRLKTQQRASGWFTWWVTASTFAERFEIDE